jgi:hypothetical protein
MSDRPIGAVRNFDGHFTTKTSVTEQVPIRSRSTNFDGTFSLFTVVPLGQIRLYFRRVNQRSEGASLPCTLARAGEHPGKGSSAETFSQLAGVLFASFGQWNVSVLVCRPDRDHSVSPCRIKYRRTGIIRSTDYAVAPHFQSRISGRS